MREIKFRVWDSTNKRMSFVDELEFHKDGNHTITHTVHRSGLMPTITVDPLNGNMAYPKWIHLMQYTGLKDKNGKEIYEGDILECEEMLWNRTFHPDKIIVEYSDGGFIPFASAGGPDKPDPESCTIIGNIFES